MPSISITSADIISGALIPSLHKNTTLCGEPNVSPQVSWTLTDILPADIVTFDLLVLEVGSTGGSGPNGEFVHWDLRGIPNTIQSFAQGAIIPPGIVIHPTDWGTGDNANGWNGPCSKTGGIDNYDIIIVANLTKTAEPIFGFDKLTSDPYPFLDRVTNISVCGNPGVQCCYLIENCKDPEDTYNIIMLPGEPTIYFDQVYILEGNMSFFNGKCFKFISQSICLNADVEGVTIASNYASCIECEPSYLFESCQEGLPNINVTFAEGEVDPVLNMIYTLNEAEGCYKYLGLDSENPATIQNVTVQIDHGTADCIVCELCYEFESCSESETIFVQFADVSNLPNLSSNNLYDLLGDSELLAAETWKFIGVAPCEGAPDVTEVILGKDYECESCEILVPYYKLTDCKDPENVRYISWAIDSPPLDPIVSYVFNFDPITCYTATLEFTPCPDKPFEILDKFDIVTEFIDCEACTKPCYALLDCESYQTVSEVTADFSPYVGKIVKWIDEADAPDYIERCAVIEEYNCLTETYPTPDITILSCHSSCEKCLPEAEPEPEILTVTRRAVKPGYSVPACDTTPKPPCNECNE